MLYKELVDLYEKLGQTTSKIKKTEIIAEFLEKVEPEVLDKMILLLMGTVFPSWSSEEIGIATRLTIKSIARAYGTSESEIDSKWKEKGDLGLIVEELAEKRKQATLLKLPLTVDKVFDNLKKAAHLEGPKSQERKLMLISELLMHADALEAKYIVRTILGDLRVGVAEGILRDAIAKAFFTDVLWDALLNQSYERGKKRIHNLLETLEGRVVWIEREEYLKMEKNAPLELQRFMKKNKVKIVKLDEIRTLGSFWKAEIGVDMIILSSNEAGAELKSQIVDLIERAYSLTNDLGYVAKIAATQGEGGLRKLGITLFQPIRVMLAQKVSDIAEAFKTVGRPAAVEYKYDGFRVQIHKDGDKIQIYTRRLENVTEQFPDIVKAVRECIKAERCVVEGESVGYDKRTGKWLPFQKISQRIKRKYEIERMAKEIPVITNLFDIIYLDGELLIDRPFRERRSVLKKIVHQKENRMILARQLITSDETEAKKFFEESLELGNEGIMFKNLNAPYKPGSRVGYMVKLKTTLETLDLVIVGAEWGEGKRSGWLTSYILACRDEDTGELLTVGKMSTGLKEKSEEGTTYEEMTDLLRHLITAEKGKEVEIIPQVVVEVSYEEIQKSPNYTSGFALRFPRFVRLREDKSVEEIDSLSRIERLYHSQRHRG